MGKSNLTIQDILSIIIVTQINLVLSTLLIAKIAVASANNTNSIGALLSYI